MAVVYNSNQVKYGGRGYLDAKMQPVANLAALQSLDTLELTEGMTVVVLNDGTGQPHDYWYIGGQWVKKDNGGGDIGELVEEVAELSASVSTLTTEMSDKVDKVSGKGLSSNDFTNELKSKLDAVENGAQKNVKANWNESDESSDAYIQNKPDLSGYVTKDTDELENYYKKSEVYTKEEADTEIDEAIDASADYTDEVLSAETAARVARDAELTASAESLSNQITSAITAVSEETQRAVSAEIKLANDVADLSEVIQGKQDAFEVGDGLVLSDNTLKVSVDESTITIAGGKLHVIGGGGSGSTYIPGQYIKIEDDVISVTGITPSDYATKSELTESVSAITEYIDEQGFAKQSHVDEQIIETRQGAYVAATAWTASQGYAYEEDVIDTTRDLLDRISASTAACDEAIQEATTALTESINEEKNRAQNVEGELRGLIDNEAARAVSAETELSDSIAMVQAAVNSETQRAVSAESALEQSIAGVSASVETESTRALSAESALSTSISAEESRAVSAETQLSNNISQVSSNLGQLSTSTRSDLSSLNAAIQNETTRATTSETQIQNNLNAQVIRLESAIAAATPVLKEDLTTSLSVGGVSAGTLFTAGTTIESIIKAIFGNGSTAEPTTQKYAYYGSLDESERMYAENPLPEEEFTEANIKARTTKSAASVSVTDEFEFLVDPGDTQIVFAIPATFLINSAMDIDNNINYTSAVTGTVNLNIDTYQYNVYYFDSDQGFGQFHMKITLKNA